MPDHENLYYLGCVKAPAVELAQEGSVLVNTDPPCASSIPGLSRTPNSKDFRGQALVKYTIGALLLCPAFLCSFQEKPWLGQEWECEFDAQFTYSRYRTVQGASKQLSAPSNDKLYVFDLGFVPVATCDVQIELEFADTPRQRFGLRSSAAQVRVAWQNDIVGDPFSWTTGLSVRNVSRHSLRDVSCPYSSDVNIELNTALGKEWSQGPDWTTHLWGLVALGMANHGSPWLRALSVFEKNWNNRHRASLFAEGYFGFGEKEHVNVHHFNGWGKFHHQSIDIGAAYRYHTDTWGEFTLAYTRRVFAHAFPENVNFFTFTYQVPFSFF